MAVTRQEIENVMGPWGAKILGEIDRYLGDNDGWVEDSDFLISSGTTYTDEKERVIKECLDYCTKFREKNFFDSTAKITSGLDIILQTPAQQLPNAKLFHDTAIACIAAISSVSEEQILKCLRDYTIIPEGKTYTVDPNKIQLEAKEIDAAKKESVNFLAPIYTKMESLGLFDIPFKAQKGNKVVDGSVLAYTTQEFSNMSPEDIVNLLMSTDFYYCSKFSDEHVKYFATLQELSGPSHPSPHGGSGVSATIPSGKKLPSKTIDILSVTYFSFLSLFESDFPITLRQQGTYDQASGEYRVKIYALPPTHYSKLLKNLGDYEATDGKMWIEWRIKSNGQKGSQVALAFSTESKLPDFMIKKMSEFVIDSIFDSYKEGFDALKKTKKRIKDTGAWDIPPEEKLPTRKIPSTLPPNLSSPR